MLCFEWGWVLIMKGHHFLITPCKPFSFLKPIKFESLSIKASRVKLYLITTTDTGFVKNQFKSFILEQRISYEI